MSLSINDHLLFNAAQAGYFATDIDQSSDPKYYGFTDKRGYWYIIEENVANGTFRYIKGTSSYITNWTSRSSLLYDYPYNIFHI